MNLLYLECIESTQEFIKKYVKENKIRELTLVYTNNQTNGIGSRNNKWDGQKGNLFFSFSILKEHLPNDLPLNSSSIYFSILLKDLLAKNGSKAWIKWPNDFYINDKKFGGTITHMDTNYLYCGIGLNLYETAEKYAFLDININQKTFLNEYLLMLNNKPTWKEIFSKYQVEFRISKKYTTTIDNQKISMKDAKLNNDGSIEIDGEKVYSLR